LTESTREPGGNGGDISEAAHSSVVVGLSDCLMTFVCDCEVSESLFVGGVGGVGGVFDSELVGFDCFCKDGGTDSNSVPTRMTE